MHVTSVNVLCDLMLVLNCGINHSVMSWDTRRDGIFNKKIDIPYLNFFLIEVTFCNHFAPE
jgi:hypothetical protein